MRDIYLNENTSCKIFISCISKKIIALPKDIIELSHQRLFSAIKGVTLEKRDKEKDFDFAIGLNQQRINFVEKHQASRKDPTKTKQKLNRLKKRNTELVILKTFLKIAKIQHF